MANVNNPHGLRPLMRTLNGGNPQVFGYTKAAAYGQVRSVSAYLSMTDEPGTRDVVEWDCILAGVLNGPPSGITAGTTRLLGVSLNYSLASLLATMLVMDDPGALFEAQGDGSGSGSNTIAAAHMGYNANLNYTGVAGAGVTRDNSGVSITESTIAVTATLDVKLRQLYGVPDNAYGIYGRVELKINKHLNNPEVTET